MPIKTIIIAEEEFLRVPFLSSGWDFFWNVPLTIPNGCALTKATLYLRLYCTYGRGSHTAYWNGKKIFEGFLDSGYFHEETINLADKIKPNIGDSGSALNIFKIWLQNTVWLIQVTDYNLTATLELEYSGEAEPSAEVKRDTSVEETENQPNATENMMGQMMQFMMMFMIISIIMSMMTGLTESFKKEE